MAHSFLGAGTSGDPYQVWNAEDLDHVRDFPSAEFKQMDDIEWDDANHWLPVPSFTGVYDGDNKKITGLHSWQDNAPSQLASEWGGLVHELTGLGMVRNVLIVGANFQGVLSLEHGSKTGGIVNVLVDGYVLNCSVFDSYIRGSYQIGGIVGYAVRAEPEHTIAIMGCAVENTQIIGANVFSVGTTAEKTGGIVGHVITDHGNSGISNCHVLSSYVTSWFSTIQAKIDVGGIVGCVEIDGVTTQYSLYQCYFAGVLEENSDVGGSLTDFGPLVGKKSGTGSLVLTHAYYDEDLLGFVYGGSYGIAKSTTWFRDEAETIDVAFSSGQWGIDSTSKKANGYPYILNTPYVEGMAGIGTDGDPYQIEDEFDLLYVDTLHENSFILVNDINLAGMDWRPIYLEGNFDGNFKTIYGMTSIQTGSDTSKWHRGGLFSTIEPTMVIQNVIISNATIETYGNTIGREQGILIGVMWGGTVRRCAIINSTITGQDSIGGLIGTARSTDGDVLIEECYVDNTYIYATAVSNCQAGGLVGVCMFGNDTYKGEILNCYAKGIMFVMNTARQGGFHGTFESSDVTPDALNYAYAIATIEGLGELSPVATGFGGTWWDGTAVSLAGMFYDADVSNLDVDEKATGLTTLQAKTQSTYETAGFNFETIWGIDELKNDGYPYLLGFEVPELLYGSGEGYGEGIGEGLGKSISTLNGSGDGYGEGFGEGIGLKVVPRFVHFRPWKHEQLNNGNQYATYSLFALIHRETYRTLSFDIKNEVGLAYNLTGCDVLLIMTTRHDEEIVLEKQGLIVNELLGQVDFNFIPEDTADLAAVAYDTSVMVISDTDEWVAIQGRLGIVARVREVMTLD